MPLYNARGSDMPQAAQSAMNSATHAMASQQKQETRTTTNKTSFWDDFYKAAKGVHAGASALNGIVDATGKAINLYDDIKIKSAYDNIAKAFGEGGYAAIQDNPDMQDYHHSQALGKFVKDRANTQQGYLDIVKKSDEAADRMYQNWRAQAMTVGDAYRKGDTEAYMNGMRQLVADSPMPYRLEPDGKGNFKELFRSDANGGWTETGRTITAQEAYDQMNGILSGERMVLRGADMKLSPANAAFNQAASRFMYATMMGNAENRLDPKKQVPLYDRNGNVAGIGVIQNLLDNYSVGPKLFAYGLNGKQLGAFDGYDQAMAHGLSPFAPQKGKGKGVGGGAAGSGEYKLTQGDTSMLVKYATRPDENGDKSTDYGTVSFLAGFMKKAGLEAPAAIAAYEENIKNAMKQGATREQAEAAVMSAMARKLNGATPTNNGNTPQSPGQQTGESNATAKAENATAARMNGALAKPPTQSEAPRSGIEQEQRNAQRMMEGIGAFFSMPRGDDDPQDIWDYRP